LRWLARFLRLVGGVSLLAFLAAVMPAGWIVEITAALELETFPDVPVAFYLARHLSLIYGFIGLGLLVIASRLPRDLDLVRWLGWCVIAFGVLQAVVDFQAGMPPWWTLGESISTVIGGGLIVWLQARCR
jgi:hypothetical protein